MEVHSYAGGGGFWRCGDAAAPSPDEVSAWLEARATTNLGTPQAFARRRGTAAVSLRGDTLTGVAIALEGGRIFLEAIDEPAAVALMGSLRASGIVPARILAALPSAASLGVAAGIALRTQPLLAMAVASVAEEGAGRLASEVDLEVLTEYQRLYDQERGTSSVRSWDELVRKGAVWVHDADGRVASVLLDNGRTSRFAAIGGTFTFPHRRRRGSARALTAWAARRLLAERPRVHLIVDEDNLPAIALYRALGFEEIGRCFVGYPR